MRRLICIAAALLMTLGASAHKVSSLDIRVELLADGSARVAQHWTVEIGSDATEWYIPIDNLGEMTLTSFQVSEGGVAFRNLGDNWDSHRSRSEKDGQCGIIRKGDGLELCWGLGNAGPHRWSVSFVLTGLVQGYEEADGFNFQFINPGMASPPQKARVTIVPAFDCPVWTYDNTRVWAFGYDGEINVSDGSVVAKSARAFSQGSSLIAMVRFEKGLFQPALTHPGKRFEALKQKALEGSSYSEDDEGDGGEAGILRSETNWWLLPYGLGILGVFFWMIWALISSALGYKYKKKFFGRSKIDGWYRDIPLGGNLFAAQFLLQKGKRLAPSASSSNLIGALFLRWVMQGKLTVEPDPRSAKRVNLRFNVPVASDDPVEEALFQMAYTAAGENQLLEKDEFERWSKRNYTKLVNWPDKAINAGRSWFRSNGLFEPGKNRCTIEGAAQACHLIEFRNMLKNFTLSDQRGANEVLLWKEYLVYAQLFGIADRVAAQFKKLYPAEFEELARQTGMHPTTLLYAMNWTNHLSTKAFNTATAKAGHVDGTGGRASFGGGGGFSGGGFGGGAR